MTGLDSNSSMYQWYTICQVMDIELIQLGIPERFAKLVRDEFIVNFAYEGVVVERPTNWVASSSDLFNGISVSSNDWHIVISNWTSAIRLWVTTGYGRQFLTETDE